jgi:acyl dehydratase
MELSGLVGRDLGQVTFPLERGKLRELALALHDDDPAWHDPDAARALGFAAVPAPPTATVLAAHWTPGGLVGWAISLGMDVRRLLHGEAAWTFDRAVALGDELTASSVVVEASRREGRRGGSMVLVTVETTFRARDGERVAVLRDTMIETAAA